MDNALKKRDSSKYIDICICGQRTQQRKAPKKKLPTANCSANESNGQTVKDSQPAKK